MDRRSESLFLSMDEVEVASSAPVKSPSPAKVLIMEDVEVASMEDVALSPARNQLTMDEMEVASATESSRAPQQALSMSEVEVQSSGVRAHTLRPRAKSVRGRSWTSDAADKGNSPQHPAAFENDAEDSGPQVTKEAEEKMETGKYFGKNFASKRVPVSEGVFN